MQITKRKYMLEQRQVF